MYVLYNLDTVVNIEDTQNNQDKINQSKLNISQIALNSINDSSKKCSFSNKIIIDGQLKDFKLKLIENHNYQEQISNINIVSLFKKIESKKGSTFSEIFNFILKNNNLSVGELGPFRNENLKDQYLFNMKFKRIQEDTFSYYIFILKDIMMEPPFSKVKKVTNLDQMNVNSKFGSFAKQTSVSSNIYKSCSSRQKLHEQKKKTIYSEISEKIESVNEENLEEFQFSFSEQDQSMINNDHIIAALLHDFKNAIFDFTCNVKLMIEKFPQEMKVLFREDLFFLEFSEGYLYSLIKFLTDFLQKKEFLMNINPSEIDLIKVIEKIIRIFNKRIEYDNINKSSNQQTKDIKFTSKIHKECDTVTMKKLYSYNENLVLSLLFNIVSNSYKYTNKGEVRIELKKEVFNNTSTLLLSIIDTGCGIN